MLTEVGIVNCNIMKSPLTNEKRVSIESTLDIETIVSLYNKDIKIDVSKYFIGIDKLFLCKDNVSGYRFFYPEIKTDSNFYEQLQAFDWYYMDSKWEFETALSQISSNAKVLEIGCGKGSFLKMLMKNHIDCVGLEFNEESIKKLNVEGYMALNSTIQDFAQENNEMFDVVVSFQVLEHVYDVYSFLLASIQTLKKGGKLIISVPNNDAFIKYTYPLTLNIPPHHAGWWNLISLKSLSVIFNIKFEKVCFEPLQSYHYDWYYNTMKNEMVKRYGKWIKVFFYPFRNYRYRYMLKLSNKFIKGHSIMTTYIK